MSKKRSVDTHFWNDTYVTELDPIEKVIFLYFLTNPLTNMLGVYEIPIRRIAFDTGIDSEMVKKIITRFDNDGKFSYIDGYLVVHKFLEHQNLNTNMKKSAETDFLDLPGKVKEHSKLERVRKALKGLGMLRKIEVESEVESETESLREGESFSTRLDKATTKKELFDLWFAYRKSKGRHPNNYEQDVLLNKDWKDKSIEQVRAAIAYTVANGWFSIQYPENNGHQSNDSMVGVANAKAYSTEL